MAKIIDVHEAKAKLSELVREAETGKRVVISRRGRPAVQLVPVQQRRSLKFGMDRGLVHMAPDFDVLPEEVLRAFEGRKA
jgi:prevent-host-death family protein